MDNVPSKGITAEPVPTTPRIYHHLSSLRSSLITQVQKIQEAKTNVHKAAHLDKICWLLQDRFQDAARMQKGIQQSRTSQKKKCVADIRTSEPERMPHLFFLLVRRRDGARASPGPLGSAAPMSAKVSLPCPAGFCWKAQGHTRNYPPLELSHRTACCRLLFAVSFLLMFQKRKVMWVTNNHTVPGGDCSRKGSFVNLNDDTFISLLKKGSFT